MKYDTLQNSTILYTMKARAITIQQHSIVKYNAIGWRRVA